MTGILEVVRQDRVLQVFLNRPEKRNALNAELCRALTATVEEAESDRAVGAIVLSAQGKAFSAGMDLSEADAQHSQELAAVHERLFTLGARLTKPLLAAIQGAALGGGMGLVANCHIVVASPEATFGLTEIRLGLWPFLIYRTVALALGERRTVELAVTGRIFGPEEAVKIGLSHEVAADCQARALEIAHSIAALSPTAIRSGLTFVQETREADWKTAGSVARVMRDEIFQTEDFQEGIRAFQQKRAPRWPSLG